MLIYFKHGASQIKLVDMLWRVVVRTHGFVGTFPFAMSNLKSRCVVAKIFGSHTDFQILVYRQHPHIRSLCYRHKNILSYNLEKR
jgi:hypothetical protein